MFSKIKKIFNNDNDKKAIHFGPTVLGFGEKELLVDTEDDYQLVEQYKRVGCKTHGEIVSTKMLVSFINGDVRSVSFCPVCYASFLAHSFPVYEIEEK